MADGLAFSAILEDLCLLKNLVLVAIVFMPLPDGLDLIIMPPLREHPPFTRSVGRGRGRSQYRQLDPIEGESVASTIRAAPTTEQTETPRHPLPPPPPTIPPVAPFVPPPPPPVPPLVLDVSISKKLKEARQHGYVSFMGESDATVAKEVVQMALRAEKLANENKRMQAELAERRNLSISSSQPPKKGKDSSVSGSTTTVLVTSSRPPFSQTQ
ncbi:PREDICTED: proline-rich protein 11-like [Theobroma cacao]|uniref:Proline-rich protein 11-like n=1 Tax=Theobroma cacao TaxID=3641 RepID=A0AB32W8W1_THECC|nr:PREDICTED: proline-rich protein 11-like [Theobroma cacao]